MVLRLEDDNFFLSSFSVELQSKISTSHFIELLGSKVNF